MLGLRFCYITLGVTTLISVAPYKTTADSSCNEHRMARCMAPHQTFLRTMMTPSWAFDLAKTTDNAQKICSAHQDIVDGCTESVIEPCLLAPIGPHSGMFVALQSFCDQGRTVLDDFPCLSENTFLEDIKVCQSKAGLYSPDYGKICQTTALMKICTIRTVIDKCDMLASERYENLTERLLLPLKINYGCSIDSDPFNVTPPPLLEDCLSRVQYCQRHLAALKDKVIEPYSITTLLSLKTPICKIFDEALDCLDLLDRCSHVDVKEVAPYWYLSDFCEANSSDIINLDCIYGDEIQARAQKCEENHGQMNPFHINYCSRLSGLMTCMETILGDECGLHLQSAIQVHIRAALQHRMKHCHSVQPVQQQYPCLSSENLLVSLDECQINSGLLILNMSSECSAIPGLLGCVETAIRASCDETKYPDFLPIIQRFTSLVTEHTPCSLNGGKRPLVTDTGTPDDFEHFDWSDTDPSEALREKGDFFSRITPMNIAVGFLLLCVLFAVVALLATYCHLRLTESKLKARNNYNFTGPNYMEAEMEVGTEAGSGTNDMRTAEERRHNEETYVVEECTSDTNVHF